MFVFFKESLLPLIIWLMVMSGVYVGIYKRPQWALLLLTVLISLPNLWYPVQSLPLGQKTMDLLIFSSLIGVSVTGMKYERPPKQGLFFALFFVTYLAVWNTTFRYGLSLPFTLDNVVLADWKNYVLMMLLYFASYNVFRTETDIRKMVMAMMFVVLFLAVQNFRSMLAGEVFSQTTRATGPFAVVGLNCNHFGAFLVHYAVFAFSLMVLDKGNAKRRLLYAAVFFGSIYPVFYTYSRGAYAAMLLGLAVVGVLRVRVILVALLIFAMMWQSILPESVVERINMTHDAGGQLEQSAALRLIVWDLAKHLFGENPIFGIGFNGFIFATHGFQLHNTHNFYLQTAAEQGVIGCILLGSVMIRALLSGWKLFRSENEGFGKAMGMGFLACTFAVLLTNVFGDRFSQLAVGGYYFLLMGAIDRLLVLKTSTVKLPQKIKSASLGVVRHASPKTIGPVVQRSAK